MYRGVTRLDGARGNKQVWRPMFKPEIFRKQMYFLKKVLVTLLWLFGPLQRIGCREILPPCPLVTSLMLCN